VRGRRILIYSIVLLCTMTVISIYQDFRVHNESFLISAQYDWHKSSAFTQYSTQDKYDTIYVSSRVFVENYSAQLDLIRVADYPFWQNVSTWSDGENATIAGNSFVLSYLGRYWNAQRQVANLSIILQYSGDLGILVSIYIDTMTFSFISGYSGYTLDITLGANNLAELASYLTGLHLVYDNLLIIGIFVELAILDWLIFHKKKGTEVPESHSDLT
jgi:hypothetical protein